MAYNVVQIDNSLWYDGMVVVTASKVGKFGYRWASGVFNRYSRSIKHPTAEAALKAAAKTIGLNIIQLGDQP